MVCESLHLSLWWDWVLRHAVDTIICIMIQTSVSNIEYSLSQSSWCALMRGHMEASQYSCITIVLILSCLVYLLTDKNKHPAFNWLSSFYFFLSVVVVWWLGFECSGSGFFWYWDFFYYFSERIFSWWYLPRAFLIATGIQYLLLSISICLYNKNSSLQKDLQILFIIKL